MISARSGSGNIGATNVLRTGNKALAAATLLLDALKGLAPVLAFNLVWGPVPAAVAAAGAVLGHMFPPWVGFKGGKGVATTLGVLLGLSWPARRPRLCGVARAGGTVPLLLARRAAQHPDRRGRRLVARTRRRAGGR